MTLVQPAGFISHPRVNSSESESVIMMPSQKKPAIITICVRPVRVLHVHEEKNDEKHLDDRDRERDDGVPRAEVDVGHAGGKRGQAHQRQKDGDVDADRHYVAVGALFGMVGHVALSSLGNARQSDTAAGKGKSTQYRRSASTTR